MAIINRTALEGNDDFLGFKFNNRHSSEFGIIRVSGGSRYNSDVLPNVKDNTIEIPGRDGKVFLNSSYDPIQFSFSFAYDELTEVQMRAMKQWLNRNQEGDLILDELPYKAYKCRVSGQPKLTFVCFDDYEQDGNIGIGAHDEDAAPRRIYKGEGTVNFVCYEAEGRNPNGKKWLDDYDDEYSFKNLSQWKDGSGLSISTLPGYFKSEGIGGQYPFQELESYDQVKNQLSTPITVNLRNNIVQTPIQLTGDGKFPYHCTLRYNLFVPGNTKYEYTIYYGDETNPVIPWTLVKAGEITSLQTVEINTPEDENTFLEVRGSTITSARSFELKDYYLSTNYFAIPVNNCGEKSTNLLMTFGFFNGAFSNQARLDYYHYDGTQFVQDEDRFLILDFSKLSKITSSANYQIPAGLYITGESLKSTLVIDSKNKLIYTGAFDTTNKTITPVHWVDESTNLREQYDIYSGLVVGGDFFDLPTGEGYLKLSLLSTGTLQPFEYVEYDHLYY